MIIAIVLITTSYFRSIVKLIKLCSEKYRKLIYLNHLDNNNNNNNNNSNNNSNNIYLKSIIQNSSIENTSNTPRYTTYGR